MPNQKSLAKIHIAKKELHLSDDVYRAILQEQFRKDSAKSLTQYQAERLINHFKRLGWKPFGKAKKSNKRTYSKPQDAQERKIVALWLTLHEAGVIRNKSDSALQKFVKRMTKIDKLSWCDSSQKHIIIEALKGMAQRKDVELV